MASPIAHGLYGVQYRLIEYTPALTPDQLVNVRVEVKNSGFLPWVSSFLEAPWLPECQHDVNLSYHWVDDRGRMFVEDGKRTFFQRPVLPGETVCLDLLIEPPYTPGMYTLQLDMVAEGYAWFSYIGLDSLSLPVEISPIDQQLPRICILNTVCRTGDAVGHSMIEHIRYFLTRGHSVHMFVEYIDTPLPADIRSRTTCISMQELRRLLTRSPNAYAAQLFMRSDWYIFFYAIDYPLLQSFWMVPSGFVMFHYHGVTPPSLWMTDDQKVVAAQSEQRVFIARFFDCVVVDSIYMREELARLSGVSSDRIQVLPLAIPQDEFFPGARDERLVEQYKLQGKRVLLYVGRMAPNKRIPDMIQALAHVRRSFPDTVLMLVGDNVNYPYNQVAADASMLAAELGCSDHVIFTGRVSQGELPSFYRLCDVYLTASVHEGFCAPVVEAMACGKPVVVANATVLPETVGDAGLLFHPGDPVDLADQILRLFDEQNESLVTELARRGVERAALFTREQYHSRLEEIFKPILMEYKHE